MMLVPSILSSSSGRHLGNLIDEIGSISRVYDFDLLIPRVCDLSVANEAEARLSHFVANSAAFDQYVDDLLSQLKGKQVNIVALATYFPNISAVDDRFRREAIDALVQVFRLAKKLTPWMVEHKTPVVEIVCGKTVEVMDDGRVGIFGTQRKIELLIDSLSSVIQKVKEEVGLRNFALALELEPGEIYLLKNIKRLHAIMDRCNNGLEEHIGFNMDIAHLRIVGIDAHQMRPFLNRIVHAHVSDHPRIHTHDQIVGSWTNVEQRRGGYVPYLQLLMERFEVASALPFTGRIAIEMEGCNRIFALHDSVNRLRHAIAIASPNIIQS